MNLYLVRHGECSGNKGSYIGSGSDISINSLGIDQLRKLSSDLKNIIDSESTIIYSSSLKRSVESSNILSRELGVSMNIDSRLNEINFGIWEGLTYNQIMQGWSDIATIWYNNPFDITPPNGEPFRDFYNRVDTFLKELKELKAYNHIVLVTHGGVIQILLTLLNNDSIDNRWKYNIGRGAYKMFSISRDIDYKTTDIESDDFRLYKQLIFKSWGELEVIPYPKPVVAINRGKPIGGLSFILFKSPMEDKKALWINSVFILPNSRRKGIASGLIEYALKGLDNSGFSEIFVYTDKPKLYTTQGWNIISEEDGSWVLRKELLIG